MQQPGLSADLDSFDLLDLIQVIQMARRDLSLVVRAGSQSLGVLRFSQGELLWAEFGELRGEEAFMALAAQQSGSIEQLPWDGRGERNVNQALARLIIQAVEYRDAHAAPQQKRGREGDAWSQSDQSNGSAHSSITAREHLNGPESQARSGNTPLTIPRVILPEDGSVPSWVREIHSAADAFSAQPTSALPPLAAGAPNLLSSYPASPDPLSSLLLEEMDAQIPQPTLPLSALNGRLLLPSIANGNKGNAQPSVLSEDEPPTVPLPSIQGGLLDYAPKRERQPKESRQETQHKPKPAAKELPEGAVTVRSVATLDTTILSPQPLPASDPSQPMLAESSVEPKPSSLSILEQLAYGGAVSNGSSEPEGASGWQNGRSTHQPVNGQSPVAASRMASPVPGGLAAPAQGPLPTEAVQHLERTLELFAGQVGAACVATALIRTDGSLVAGYRARSSQEQELASPAYHLAHVMQSSLRALLMGGWGDLEDTIITGSTHSIMLRRLGRPEKGLFHVAVLERSGNPGLCRVRMRNSEPALLQQL